MKKKHPRIIAKLFLFSLLIAILCFVPASAATKTVAKIGDTSYTSIKAAVKAVKKGQTIKLQKNVTIKSSLTLNKNTTYTLNLNGYKLNVNKATISEYTTGMEITKGTVTIKNGTIVGNLVVRNGASVKLASITATKGDIVTYHGGKTTINSGTYITFYNFGTVVIKKATFKGTSGKSYSISNYGTMTIKGGTYTTGGILNSSIYAPEYSAILTISGGTFTDLTSDGQGHGSGTVLLNGSLDYPGEAIITGGTFKGNNLTIENLNTASVMTITGGTFITTMENCAVIANRGKITVNGGTFITQTAGISAVQDVD